MLRWAITAFSSFPSRQKPREKWKERETKQFELSVGYAPTPTTWDRAPSSLLYCSNGSPYHFSVNTYIYDQFGTINIYCLSSVNLNYKFSDLRVLLKATCILGFLLLRPLLVSPVQVTCEVIKIDNYVIQKRTCQSTSVYSIQLLSGARVGNWFSLILSFSRRVWKVSKSEDESFQL